MQKPYNASPFESELIKTLTPEEQVKFETEWKKLGEHIDLLKAAPVKVVDKEPTLYRCVKCMRVVDIESVWLISSKHHCIDCFTEIDKSTFNEPEHYHKHQIDTIQFLQEGFPPSVFKGFAIGSAVKYIHRYENKNGMEDLLKAKDYIERLIAFHKEKPSK